MDTPEDISTFKSGDVFQINESEGRRGWIGTLVMASEIRPWGIIAFIAVPEAHDEQSCIYVRLQWSMVDYLGHAQLVPQA